jgi:hypothetical protein
MARRGTPGAGRHRDAVRWGLLVAAVAVTGYRLPQMFHDFREWRFALRTDPSTADLYWTKWVVDVVGMAVVLCVGSGLFYLLRSPAKNRQ